MSIPSAPMSLGVGDMIADKYRVERILGQGAMGAVYAAVHVGLGQRVAIKVLLAQQVTQAQRERFLREARAVVPLRSQHVTRVSDVGTLPNGVPYLAMELLDGTDLDAVLEKRGPLPVPEAVEYVLQACEAIAEAHRNGIVHRDLKPANLFLTTNLDGSPCIKVLDFGVSKVSGADSLKLTAEGASVGTPFYMSPEQVKGAPDVDERADIWALGAILYELVAGRTPFHCDTMLELNSRILVLAPTPLTTYLPAVPPQFEAVILQCLDKVRERRWSNAAALANALVPFAPPRAVAYGARVAAARGVTMEPSQPADVLSLRAAMARAAEPASSVRAPLAVIATTNGATSRSVRQAPQRTGGLLVAGLAIGLLGAALGGVAVMRLRTDQPASAVAATAPGPAVLQSATTTTAVPPAELPKAPASVVTVTPEPGPTVSATASATVIPSASAVAKSMGPQHGPVPRPTPLPAPPVPATRPPQPSGNPYDHR